jgi:hypothetical protein
VVLVVRGWQKGESKYNSPQPKRGMMIEIRTRMLNEAKFLVISSSLNIESLIIEAIWLCGVVSCLRGYF